MQINWNSVNPKDRKYELVQLGKTFYFELITKPNVEIIGITVYMWKRYDFEIIYTSNDVMNIQDAIGKVFGYRER